MKRTEIKVTEVFGRGVYALETIEKGAWIEAAHVLVLSCEDTLKVNQTDLKHYVFSASDDQDCLVLGNGELYNHSDEPNVSYELTWLNDVRVMVFKALRDIDAGEQLFTNYNQDVEVDISSYTINLK